MRRLAAMVSLPTALALLVAPPALAQSPSEVCSATQSQLPQKRAELQQARAQVMRLTDAVTAYREGIQFQRQNATEGVLDTILASVAGYAQVVKGVADSTITAAEAFAPAPLKPAAKGIKTTYDVITGGIESAYNFRDGEYAKATAGALGVVSKGVSSTAPGVLDDHVSDAQALTTVSKSMKGASALKDGNVTDAIANTIEAIPGTSDLVKVGTTLVKSERQVFEGLDKTLDAQDLRTEISDRAKVSEAQFTARMNAKAREQDEAQVQVERLKNEVAVLEWQNTLCAPPQQLFAGPAGGLGNVSGGDRGPAGASSYSGSSYTGSGFWGSGSFSSLLSPGSSGRTASTSFLSPIVLPGTPGTIPAGVGQAPRGPTPLPVPPPLKGTKPADPRPPSTGSGSPTCHAPGTSGGCQ